MRAVAKPGQLTLLNGDRVQISGGPGGVHAAFVGGSGRSLAGSLVTVQSDQQMFVIPSSALPYLGRGLDQVRPAQPPAAVPDPVGRTS